MPSVVFGGRGMVGRLKVILGRIPLAAYPSLLG